MFTRIALVFLVSITTISCKTDVDNNNDSQTMNILSYRSVCHSMIQTLCLTATDGNGNKYNEYNGIADFKYSWGHNYVLAVKITKIDNPPADASNLRYQLEKIVSTEEDVIGKSYSYNLVELSRNTFTKKDSAYYFLDQPFKCGVGVDCDGLVKLNNSGGLVNVNFTYIGNGEIELSQWN